MRKKSHENRVTWLKRLLSKLKHSEESDMLWTFSHEETLDHCQKVNRSNDRWLCASPAEVPTIIHTKLPSYALLLYAVSQDGHAMPP